MSTPEIETLKFDDVMAIHQTLVDDFAASGDPISPSGLRGDGALLHSAVSRQFVGLGISSKYSTPIESAATLCYGVCCNHAFHNGNKRTALVSLLCHLDKNGLTFKEDVSQEDLYDFMLRITAVRQNLGIFEYSASFSELSCDVKVLTI